MLGVSLALAALPMGLALWLVHDLDGPWAKARIRTFVRDRTGVEFDYGAVRVGLLSGFEVDDLAILTPVAFRSAAPELVRVGRIRLAWSLSSLLGSATPISSLTLRDATLTVVEDELGRSSLAALAPPGGAPPPATVPTPLSLLPAKLLRSAPPIGSVEVDRLSLSLVRTDHGRIVERLWLSGLGLREAARRGANGWALDLATRDLEASKERTASPADGRRPKGVEHSNEIQLRRELAGAPAGVGLAKLTLTAEVSGAAAKLDVALRVVKQTLAPGLGVDQLLNLSAAARFDQGAGKVTLEVAKLEAADGAATLHAAFELPDDPAVAPSLQDASGAIDLARLAQLVPARLMPATLGRGQLRFRFKGLLLGMLHALRPPPVGRRSRPLLAALPRLAPGGVAELEGEIDRLRWPRPEGPREGSGPPASAFDLDAARISLAATMSAGGGLDLKGMVGFAELRAGTNDPDAGPARARLRAARVDLSAAGLQLQAAGPLGLWPPVTLRGDLEITGKLEGLELSSGRGRLVAGGIHPSFHARFTGPTSLAAELRLAAERLDLLDGAGRSLARGPAQLKGAFSRLRPDLVAPARSEGTVRLEVGVGGLGATLDATKVADALDFALTAKAKSLAAVRPLLGPAAAAQLDWARLGFALRSEGRVEGLSSPSPKLTERSSLRLDDARYRGAAATVAARSIDLRLHSAGGARQQTGGAELSLTGLSVGDHAAFDDALALALAVDLAAPRLRLEVEAKGGGPTGALTAILAFDRGKGVVSYDVTGRVARLGDVLPLRPTANPMPGDRMLRPSGLRPSAGGAVLLPGMLRRLELALDAKGRVRGVILGVGPNGRLRVAPRPLDTASLDGTIELRAKALRVSSGETSIDLPSAVLLAKLHRRGLRGSKAGTSGPESSIDGQIDIEALRFAEGKHELAATGLHEAFVASLSGDPAVGAASVTSELRVRSIHQDWAKGYPVGDLVLAVAVARDLDGVIELSRLRFDNPGGGTTLTLEGGCILGERRRKLSLRGELTQDLSRLWIAPEAFEGRGQLTASMQVESPDLSIFRTSADVRLSKGQIRLPEQGIEVDDLEGEIPARVTLAFDGSRFRLVRADDIAPYSMLRFADQHPLLSRPSFLSIGRIVTPDLTIAPLAGNVALDQNLLSIDQLELGVRGGRISGQCALDWNGLDSTLEAHVRANGVLSSHGEPFDGNAALVIGVRERSIDGHAEVLRIGRRHLLDLLDLQDPHRTNAAANRIRRALAVGYPDHISLAFDHGFASARVAFGGLARFVQVGELRGIPMEPLVDKIVASFSRTEDPE